MGVFTYNYGGQAQVIVYIVGIECKFFTYSTFYLLHFIREADAPAEVVAVHIFGRSEVYLQLPLLRSGRPYKICRRQ